MTSLIRWNDDDKPKLWVKSPAEQRIEELERLMARAEWRKAFDLALELQKEGLDHSAIDTSLAVGFQERMLFSQAFEAASRAIEKDPENTVAPFYLIRAARGLGYKKLAAELAVTTKTSDLDKLLFDAKVALESSDFAATERYASDALSISPKSETALTYYHSGRWHGSKNLESRDELERMYMEDGCTFAGRRLALGYELNGEFDSALQAWHRYFQLGSDPQDPFPFLAMVRVVYGMKGPEAALREIQFLPPSIIGLPEVLFQKAWFLDKAGRLKEAEEVCWKLIELSPVDSRIVRFTSYVLRRRRRWFAFFRLAKIMRSRWQGANAKLWKEISESMDKDLKGWIRSSK